MAKNNQILVRSAEQGMNKFRNEVASELGLTNYESIDRGELTSRQNGYVGGNMVKKMVTFAEQQINQSGSEVVHSTETISIPEYVKQQNLISNGSENHENYIQ